MWRIGLLACCLLWCGPGIAQGAAKDRLLLKDGSVLVGKVKRMDETLVIFQTSHGTLTIERSKIKKLEIGVVSSPPRKRPKTRDDGLGLGQFDKYKGRRAPPPRRHKPRPKPRKRKAAQDNRPQYDGPMRTIYPRRGFLVAGLSTGIPAYSLSLLIGLIGYSAATAAKDGRTALHLGVLMVPVIGPFITWGLVAQSGINGIEISYPWLGILGLAQVLATVFIVLGATGSYKVPDRRYRRRARWQIAPYATLDGGGVQLFGTF